MPIDQCRRIVAGFSRPEPKTMVLAAYFRSLLAAAGLDPDLLMWGPDFEEAYYAV